VGTVGFAPPSAAAQPLESALALEALTISAAALGADHPRTVSIERPIARDCELSRSSSNAPDTGFGYDRGRPVIFSSCFKDPYA
jgi:hypothetical protein